MTSTLFRHRVDSLCAQHLATRIEDGIYEWRLPYQGGLLLDAHAGPKSYSNWIALRLQSRPEYLPGGSFNEFSWKWNIHLAIPGGSVGEVRVATIAELERRLECLKQAEGVL